MPYIKTEDRKKVDDQINELILAISEADPTGHDVDGFVNYSFTRIIHHLYDLVNRPTYKKSNAAMGVLGCIAQELYRRKVAPYEDTKIIENGDVK